MKKLSFKGNVCVIAFITFSILLSSKSFFTNNSYWWDELYSISGSSLSLQNMFEKYVSNDSHPPLYLLLLKLWENIFGYSEISTRFLSFIFSISAIFSVSYWSLKKMPNYIAVNIIVFFSSSWLVSYYAQETRSYSLMLFLATISTILYLKVINSQEKTPAKLYLLLLLLLLLSLTHYFGLIFSGMIIIYLFFLRKDIKEKTTILLTGIIILVWPFIHFTYGNIGKRTGGDFWIKSDGIQTTVATFVNSILPQSVVINKIIPTYSSIITSFIFLATILIYIYKRPLKNVTAKKYYKNLLQLSYLGVGFIVIIALIDLHSPISIFRNFIVILPLTSIIFGILLSGIKNKTLMFYTILLFGVSSFYIGCRRIIDKTSPMQNHKACANFIVDKGLNNTHKLFYGVHYKNSFPLLIYKGMASHYLPKNTNLTSVMRNNVEQLQPPFVYISQYDYSFNYKKVINTFKLKGINIKFYEPNQSSRKSSFVLYSE